MKFIFIFVATWTLETFLDLSKISVKYHKNAFMFSTYLLYHKIAIKKIMWIDRKSRKTTTRPKLRSFEKVVVKTLLVTNLRRRTVKKSGGGGSNVVGIICPLVTIGLTDLSKTGGGALPPTPLLRHLFEPFPISAWKYIRTVGHVT